MPANVNKKGRRINGGFLAIPHEVLRSGAYKSLSASAVKLLVDLGGQFTGSNNGDLCASMTMMKVKGWSSTATLHKAKQELLRAGLIEQTRQGGMNLGPSLYAVTWKPIDACEDKRGNRRHDAKPTKVPSSLWRELRAVA